MNYFNALKPHGKRLPVLLLFICITQLLFAQDAGNFNSGLTINGISFCTSKSTIEKNFGRPFKKILPQNRCNFFAGSRQRKVYSLGYNNLLWTGNNYKGYVLYEVKVPYNSNYKIAYKGTGIDANTSKKELIRLTGAVDNISFLELNYPDTDDTYRFYFFGKRLHKIVFWSHC